MGFILVCKLTAAKDKKAVASVAAVASDGRHHPPDPCSPSTSVVVIPLEVPDHE